MSKVKTTTQNRKLTAKLLTANCSQKNIMFQTTLKNNSGFTLIEMLIYVLIVSAIALAGTQFTMEVIKGQNKSRSDQEVQDNARFAMETMTKLIRSADGVDVAASIFDTSPGKLVLNMSDAAKHPTIFEVDAQTDSLTMKEGNDPVVNLTSNEIDVSNLIFKNLSPPKVQPNIKINIDLTFTNPSGIPDFNANFALENTISIRK